MIWVIPEKLRRSALDSVRDDTMLIKIICQTHNIFRRRNIGANCDVECADLSPLLDCLDPPSDGRVNAGFIYSRSTSRSRLLHKLHRHAIHAVTQSRRLWAIIEHMTQVAVTAGARHLSSRHAQTLVRFFDDVLFLDWRPETGPSGARIKLLFGAKHRQLASRALESSLVVNVIQRSRECIFSSLVAQ